MVLAPLSRALAFLGRHGTVFFAISIFLGLALPQLASSLRPMLAITVFVFIMLTFARTDGDNLRQTLGRPWRFLAAYLWMSLSVPLAMLAVFAVLPRERWNPDVLLGVSMYAAAPALMGCPAYATLLGFRNGLIVAILFLSLAMSPLLSPLLTSFLVGHGVPIDSFVLTLRLLTLVGGAVAAGLALRRFAGPVRLGAWKHQIDGFGVFCYFLFAIPAMDGVIGAVQAKPLWVLGLLALSSAIMLAAHLLTLLVMDWLGANDAFTLSLGTSLRNVGMLIAALGSATPADAYLFFALSQFPVYMAPLLASPLARVYRRRSARAAAGIIPLERPS